MDWINGGAVKCGAMVMRLVRKTGLLAQKEKCLKSYADVAGVKM